MLSEEGRAGIAVKQPLANRHDLHGEFAVGPVPDPLGGPPNFFHVEDDGTIKGTYELALAVRQVVAEDTTLEVGMGYRKFEINGLQPAPDPNIQFSVDAVDSLQFYGALRRYFLGPDWMSDRWRWFVEGGLFFVPGISVDSELQFLTTSQPISSEGSSYKFLALTAGAAYALTDQALLELGATWEQPLETLKVDLSTSVDFGGGQVIDVPIEADMRPIGGILFVSLTWFPFA